MKKIFPVLTLTILVILMVPSIASAQEIPNKCTITRDLGITGCPTGECNYTANHRCGLCCTVNAVYTVSDWIFVGLIALSVIFVLVGAITLLTSAGAPEQVAKGRNYVMYAAIGLIVALLARAIPALMQLLLI